ncbi:hypothetical protein Bbelb_180080 [Branchiostoma belcheri]|nr:hypothetical protein Bbelb_180080 [Branchiostoma belcheri]
MDPTVPEVPPPRKYSGMEVCGAKQPHENKPEEGENRKYEDGETILASISALHRAAPTELPTPHLEGMEVTHEKHSPEKEPKQEENRKYEDGESILVLTSGLHRTVPTELPTRHLEGMEVTQEKHSPEEEPKQEENRKYEDGETILALISALHRAAPTELPTRHLDGMEVTHEKHSPEKEPKQEENRKYEDGESIRALTSGLHRAVPTELPSRHREGMKVNHEKHSPEEEPKQEENRKYEDGESIRALTSGLHRTVPTELPTRYHEGMGMSGEEPQELELKDDRVNVMLDAAAPNDTNLLHLDMGDHVVVYPEHLEDLCSDKAYTQEDADRDEEPETSGVAWDCAIRMWKKVKSSNVCWFAMGCCVLVISTVLTATIIAPRLTLRGKMSYENPDIKDKMEKTKASASPIFYKDNSSAIVYSISTTPFKDTLYDTEGFTAANVINSLTTTALTCKSGWREYKNHCYRFFRDKVDWHTANKRCKQHGANLASVTGVDENSFITHLIAGAPKGIVRNVVWFGLNRLEGQWKWTDGSPYIYKNWAPNEPGRNFHGLLIMAYRSTDDGITFPKIPLGESQFEESCQEAKTSSCSRNDVPDVLEGSDSSANGGDDHDIQGTNPAYNQTPNPMNSQTALDPDAQNVQCYNTPYPRKLNPTYGQNLPSELQDEDREGIQRIQPYAVRHQGEDDGNNDTRGTVTESDDREGVERIQPYAVRYQGDDDCNNDTRGTVAESGQTIDGEDNIEPYAVCQDDMLGTQTTFEDAQRQVPPSNAPVSHGTGNNVRQEQATLGSRIRKACVKFAPVTVAIPISSIIIFLVIFFTSYQGSLQGMSTNDTSTNGNGNVPTEKPTLTVISGTSEGIYGAKAFPYYMGVAVSADNEIFVTDRENRRIQVFSLDGRYLRQFPTVVPGNETAVLCKRMTVMKPYDVDIGVDNDIWVFGGSKYQDSITRGHCFHVVQYSRAGLPKTQLETGWGLFPGPTDGGITVDVRNSRILAAVWGKMLVFEASEEDGYVYKGRQFEKRPLYTTGRLTTNNEGNVFLSDQSSNTVYVYDTYGTFLFKFGSEEGQLAGPRGICVDNLGHIIVANTFNDRVDMFSHSGDFVRTVLNILKPIGVSMGPGGQLVVTSGPSVTIVPRQMVYPSQ